MRLLRRGWLADQAPAVRAEVLQRGRLISGGEGESLFHAGDDPGGIFGVVAGGVAIRIACRSDEPRLAHIGRCGLWFGYGPLVRGGPRSMLYTFSLTEPSWLFSISLAKLQEIVRMSPEHQRALLSVSDYGIEIAVHTVETLMIRNTDRRIAATLLRVSPPVDEAPSGAPVEVRLTQAQLGEMANAERKVVNRALSRMVARGWLDVSYGRIRLLAPDALDAFSKHS